MTVAHLYADIELFIEGLKYVQKMKDTASYKAGVIREVDPGKELTDDEWKGRNLRQPVASTVELTNLIYSVRQKDREHGSSPYRKPKYAATREERMREHGTEGRLPIRIYSFPADQLSQLYGVKNLRVCDNSVLPLHFTAHTQISAYIIGEKCKLASFSCLL